MTIRNGGSLKTVYNDGNVAIHFVVEQILNYDDKTLTVRKCLEGDFLSTAITKRAEQGTGQFLQQFPVGSVHNHRDLGGPGLPVVNYTDEFVVLDLPKFAQYAARG